MTRVVFNDGEGLVHSDFELLRDTIRRVMLDELFGPVFDEDGMIDRSTGGTTPFCRFYRGCGAMVVSGGSFNVSGLGSDHGLVFQRGSLNPPADADVELNQVLYLEPGDSSFTATLDAPTGGGVFRRDIMEVRLVSDDEPLVSRDFKDAVTGALSTSMILKRKNTVLEQQIIKGVDQASAALADSNEPATTAGWTKIASFRVDDGATGLDPLIVRDYRVPVGYWHRHVGPRDLLADTALWDLNGPLQASQIGAGTDEALVPGPTQFWQGGPSDSPGLGRTNDNRRIRRLIMGYFDLTSSEQFELERHPLHHDLQHLVNVAVQDVSSLIVSTGVQRTVLFFDTGLTPDTLLGEPLWSNGLPNPVAVDNIASGGFFANTLVDGSNPTQVMLRIEGNTTSSGFHFAHWEGWGK